VNLSNIKEYASTLPDMISVGSLTHSSKSVDFSLEID
jgi:nicotinate-nucleotide pyrophosphorylase (carboxylating)